MPHPPNKITSVNLDLLRAVAVLCVFASHLLGAFQNETFGSLGRFGVILFFVHTSLVLMESLERLNTTSGSDSRLVQAFWLRRAFRIYPLAILFVVLAAAFRIPVAPGQLYTWIGTKAFLANLALAQNLTYSPDILGPLWSLPLEVQMYVLLPFAYFAIRGRRHYRSILLWILSVILALTLPRLSARLSVFIFAPCFTSGIVAYDLIRSRQRTWKLPAWTWPIGIVLLILLFGPHDNINLYVKIQRAWAISLALGVFYANVHELPTGLPQRIAHWIAEHSYGIYLSHIVIIWFAIDRMHAAPLWARILVLATGAIAIPALLYVSIEQPLILAGHHVARRLLHTKPKDTPPPNPTPKEEPHDIPALP
jgi:peptidoglycan/LPS O-acetylase OafA/YrhL